MSDPDDVVQAPRVTRPPNAWIIYRSAKIAELKAANGGMRTGHPQASLSKAIAEQWRLESPQIRYQYEQEAELRKIEHRAAHPEWSYKPRRRTRGDELSQALDATKPIAPRPSPSPKRSCPMPIQTHSSPDVKLAPRSETDLTHAYDPRTLFLRIPSSPVDMDEDTDELSPETEERFAPASWPGTSPYLSWPVPELAARSPLAQAVSDVRQHQHSPDEVPSLPIQPPTMGLRLSGLAPFPFVMDEALAVATQRFDSLGLPVDHPSHSHTSQYDATPPVQQMPMPVIDDAGRYAPIMPDYQFPPRSPTQIPSIQQTQPSYSDPPSTQSSPLRTAGSVPSWWPYRNVRVRRDEKNGVPLHRLLAELAEETERSLRAPHLQPQASVESASAYLSGWQ